MFKNFKFQNSFNGSVFMKGESQLYMLIKKETLKSLFNKDYQTTQLIFLLLGVYQKTEAAKELCQHAVGLIG